MKPRNRNAVREFCGCGRLWRGPPGTNPSLGCDRCYPPETLSLGEVGSLLGLITISPETATNK